MQTIDSWAVVANALIGIALVRHRLGSVQVSFSQALLYNSLTIVLVGSYLITVGVLTKVISALGAN